MNFSGEYNTEYEQYSNDLDPTFVDNKYIGVVLLLACEIELYCMNVQWHVSVGL